MIESTYSTCGPECPYCGNKNAPDERHYFDEDTTELDCQKCEKTFRVDVCNSTSWACRALRRMPSPAPLVPSE